MSECPASPAGTGAPVTSATVGNTSVSATGADTDSPARRDLGNLTISGTWIASR